MAFLVYLCIALCMPALGQVTASRLCADQECKEPISEARVMLTYVADSEEKINAKRGDIVKVYSKEMKSGLWEVKIHGKRGYMPASFLQESKMFKTKDLVEVPAENKSAGNHSSEKNSVNIVLDKNVPDSGFVSESFAVVDGTTFYTDTPESTLETEPMKTTFVASTVEKPLTYQFAKTIDATSIGKNKLDEPNDSLILPQPTTSSDVNYRESSQTVTPNLPEREGIYESNEGLKISDVTADSIESEEETSVVDAGNEDRSLAEETERIESTEEEEEEEEGGEDEDEEEEEEEELEEEQEENGNDEEEEQEAENSKKVDDVVKEIMYSEDEVKKEIEVNTEVEEDRASSNETNVSERNGVLETSNNPPSSDMSVEDLTAEVSLIQEASTTKFEEVTTSAATEEMPAASVSLDEKIEQKFVENIPVSNFQLDITPDSKKDAGQGEENSSEEILNNYILENKDLLENEAEREKTQSLPESHYQENDSYENVENIELKNREGTVHSDINKELEKQLNERHQKSNLLNEGMEGDNSSRMQDREEGNVISISSPDVPSVDTSNMKQQSVESEITTRGESSDVISDEEDRLIGESSVEEVQFTSEESKVHDPALVEAAKAGYEEEPVNTFSFANFISSRYRSVVNLVIGSQEAESESLDNSGITENELSDKERHIFPEKFSGTCKAHTPGCEPESSPPAIEQLPASQAEWRSSSQESERSDVVLELNKSSFDTVLYLIVTAVTVLIFSLGHYYIEKKRRDGSLIAKINTLEKALMVSSQEKFELRDELEKIAAHRKLSDDNNVVADLLQEYEECKAARIELEEQNSSLEKELEAATEAGLELNRMMSELLSAQHGSDTLMRSVEHLQKQLDSQQGTISTMNACLTAKNLENETLQSELNLAVEQINNLKEQLENSSQTLTRMEKEKTDVEQSLLVKNQAIEQKLVEALESKSADSQRLCRELDALQDVLDETRKTLLSREGEVAVLRDILNNSDNFVGGDHKGMAMEELLEVGRLRANVEMISLERENLKERVRGEEDARKLLEDHVKIVSEEVSTLRAKYEEAEREKLEAQTRLEVLSNYFKEKETQLQKELGLQEAMFLQKEGDVLSTIERIKLFQEEIESYKAQNELLKKEILDQERSMKAQIVTLENKVHENWVAARQAERRLEESKQEASQLRNRLTLKGRRVVGTMPGPDVKSEPGNVEHNGEVPSSPALMNETPEIPSSPLHYGLPASPPLLPPPGQPLPHGPFPPGLPPPPMFLPPGAPGLPPFPLPPGGFFPDDLRPPPLGRMSSPPPAGTFSPYDDSPPRTPPNRPYRSPIQYDDSPSRYRQQSPSSGAPAFSGPYPPAKWDDRSGPPPRSSFRPLYRDSPQEPKERSRGVRGRHSSEAGSAISSGHSSDSLEKGGRPSNRV